MKCIKELNHGYSQLMLNDVFILPLYLLGTVRKRQISDVNIILVIVEDEDLTSQDRKHNFRIELFSLDVSVYVNYMSV